MDRLKWEIIGHFAFACTCVRVRVRVRVRMRVCMCACVILACQPSGRPRGSVCVHPRALVRVCEKKRVCVRARMFRTGSSAIWKATG